MKLILHTLSFVDVVEHERDATQTDTRARQHTLPDTCVEERRTHRGAEVLQEKVSPGERNKQMQVTSQTALI